MSKKKVCLIKAPVGTRSGYGSHSRDLVKSLIEMDRYDIKIVPTRWGSTPMNALNYSNPNDKAIVDRFLKEPLTQQPDLFIQVTIPNEFERIGKFNLGITAGIETTACSHTWIEGLNRMDLVIVPSNHSKDVFENVSYKKYHKQTKQEVGELRCETPIEVLFEGVDVDTYSKDSYEEDEDLDEVLNAVEEDFNFLFVGHWLQGEVGEDRKNVGYLVQTFLTVFRDQENPPGLILKSGCVDFSVIDREMVLDRIRDIKEKLGPGDYPNVHLLHGDLTNEQMAYLYNHDKVKAHVSFQKGEGFGRPLLEASLSGKPVICTGWSGPLDFLDEELAVLLSGEVKPVHHSAANEWIVQGSEWFNVNLSDAARTLDHVHDRYDKYTENAEKLANRNKKKFSMEKMTEEFENILNEYIKLPEEVEIKLPKLNLNKKEEEKEVSVNG